jgi:hypothetical protein
MIFQNQIHLHNLHLQSSISTVALANISIEKDIERNLHMWNFIEHLGGANLNSGWRQCRQSQGLAAELRESGDPQC